MKKSYSVGIAMGVSLFIYVFYRSDKTVVNELVIFLFSLETYAAIKSSIVSTIPLNDLVIFSLPGGLWVFCATTLSQGFYLRGKHHNIQVTFIPVAFAVGLEFCQLIHLTNGRFDVLDIAAYLLFYSLACYLFESRHAPQKVLSPFTLPGFICLACILSVYLAHVSQ